MTTYRVNDNGVDREMTSAERAAYETFQTEAAKELAAKAAAIEAAVAAKVSARAKLTALGLTEAEVSALLGA
jgi:hypothetical protein